MNGNHIIVLGIIIIAFGTGLTIYGQQLLSKSENDKILSQNNNFLEKIKKYQKDIKIKDKKIKELEKWEKKITIKYLEEIHIQMNSLYETISSYSKFKIESKNIESFKKLCKGFNLNQKTNIRISVNKNTYHSLRSLLLLKWENICIQISNLSLSTSYIHPKAYELFLRIREKGEPISILKNTKNSNKDLESWHETFYEMYKLTNELKKLKKEINSY
ncbi:hypothetical protein MC378_14590 [Polaribacter sp. MSW13]|uniref:Uncharacterized protein n=1 Tax=Polaribacter marinus TaxID=2916838 RepID=A0A9X1VPJ1_9FLAO|nr:hypothetical protein [Polaribacter marinus]MCI2230404.1 hypothetical protein [Polaribacter marinus]